MRNVGAKLAEKGTALDAAGNPIKPSTLGTSIRYLSGKGTDKERKTWDKGAHKWIRRMPFIGLSAMLMRRGLAELTEQHIKETDKIEKSVTGKSVEMKNSLLEQAVSPTRKAAILNAAQKDGDINDMSNVPKDEELEKLLGKVMQANAALMGKSLRFLDPKATANAITKLGDRLTEAQKSMAGVSFKESDKKAYGTLEGKLLSKMKTAKLEYMDEDAADRYVGKGGLGHKFFTGAIMAKGAEIFGRKFIDTFVQNAPSAEWYKEHNMSLYNWTDSSPARGLGVARGNLGKGPDPIDPTDNISSDDNSTSGEREPGTGGRE